MPADARSLEEKEYRVAFELYTKDGRRGAKVLEFSHGETYLLELEGVEGAFTERHSGRLVGPFASPDEAERFVVATAWFTGNE